MDFLNFRDVSFLPDSSIGRLCEDLNNIVGHGVWYGTFQVKNIKWLCVTTMNSDKVLCCSFGLYPSYAAGILNAVKEIHFYVLCSEKLNYADYIEKCIAGKEHSVTYKPHRRDEFRLSSSGETIALSFEAREFPKQPSELIFAQSLLKKICLSSLAFGIVCINKRVAYITNEVLTSRHDCVFESYTCDFELPKKAGWLQIVTRYCIVKKTCPFYMLYCSKKSHRLF